MHTIEEVINDFFDYIKNNYFNWLSSGVFSPKLPESFNIFDTNKNNESIWRVQTLEARYNELYKLLKDGKEKIEELDKESKIREANRIADELKKLFDRTNIFFEEKKSTDEVDLFWKEFEELCKFDENKLDCQEFIFPDSILHEANIRIPTDTYLNDCTFNCKVMFTAKNKDKNHFINLKNSIFNEDVNFYDIEIASINLSESEFKKDLIFHKTIFNFFDSEINYETEDRDNKLNDFICDKNLRFESCNIKKHKTKTSIDKTFTIQNAIINKIIIDESGKNPICELINFYDLSLTNGLSINARNKPANIEILRTEDDSSKRVKIHIYNAKSLDLEIDQTDVEIDINCYAINKIQISNAKISGYIKDSIGNLNESKKETKSIYLKGVDIEEDLFIEIKKIKDITIIESGIYAWLTIKEDKNLDEGNFLAINDVGISKEGSLKVGNGKEKKYENIDIIEVDNSGSINIIGAQIYNSLNIDRSAMGNTELHRIKMDKNSKAEIQDSSIEKIRFFNFLWCPMENINAGQEEFRQLKYAYEDQKNMIEATKFYAKELSIYHEEIKQNKKTQKDHEDIIMLTASKLLSDHGLSWAKPLIWMILIAIIGIHTSTIFLVNTQHLMGAILSVMVISGWFGIIFDSLNNNVKIKETILISFFFSTIILWVYLLGFRQIDIAMNFINPFSTDFKTIYDECQEMGKWEKIIMFLIWILYKTFFILTSYHMIVALKRITKF